MKAKRVFRLVTVVLLFAVLVIGTASGFRSERNDRYFNNEGRRGGQGDKLIGLTEGQKEQMKTLRLNLMKEITPIKNELGIKSATLKAASTGDNVSVKEVNKLIEEIGALKVEMNKKQFAHKQSVRSLLTDDQKIMFDSRSGQKHMRGQRNGMEQNRNKEFAHKKHMRNRHENRANAE